MESVPLPAPRWEMAVVRKQHRAHVTALVVWGQEGFWSSAAALLYK